MNKLEKIQKAYDKDAYAMALSLEQKLAGDVAIVMGIYREGLVTTSEFCKEVITLCYQEG